MTSTNKPKAGFWIIAVLALIWNLMGAFMYIQQKYKTETFESQYTSEQLEMVYNMPAWATTAFAIAVFGGLLASLALLFRKKLAKTLFLVSLAGIIVHMIYNIFISGAMDVFGAGVVIMPIMVLVIGVFLYIYSKNSITKGWLS